MVGSIVVVGALTCCALLCSVYDLKAAPMNMQHNLIWELVLYKFKMDHNAMEATKNIYCVKDGDADNHNTVTRWFKGFCLVCKNLNNQASSGGSKTVDSKAMLRVIDNSGK